MFPDEFWEKLLLCKRVGELISDSPGDHFVRHWVNDVVYSRMSPSILKKMKEINLRSPRTRQKIQTYQFPTMTMAFQNYAKHPIKRNTVLDVPIATGQDFPKSSTSESLKYSIRCNCLLLWTLTRPFRLAAAAFLAIFAAFWTISRPLAFPPPRPPNRPSNGGWVFSLHLLVLVFRPLLHPVSTGE